MDVIDLFAGWTISPKFFVMPCVTYEGDMPLKFVSVSTDDWIECSTEVGPRHPA